MYRTLYNETVAAEPARENCSLVPFPASFEEPFPTTEGFLFFYLLRWFIQVNK